MKIRGKHVYLDRRVVSRDASNMTVKSKLLLSPKESMREHVMNGQNFGRERVPKIVLMTGMVPLLKSPHCKTVPLVTSNPSKRVLGKPMLNVVRRVQEMPVVSVQLS